MSSEKCPRCGILSVHLVPLNDNGKGHKMCRPCKRIARAKREEQ